MIGLLYQALQQEAVRQPPAPALDALRLRAWETMRQDLILSAELAKLLDIFAEERIGVISLKGPALREILYGHKGLRSSTDLDLLVHAPDAPRARRLLESRGYRLESALHWSSENALFRCRDSEISFAGPVRVDLHWRLLPGYFPGSFDESQVWNNPRVVPFAGTEASDAGARAPAAVSLRAWHQAYLGTAGMDLRCRQAVAGRAGHGLVRPIYPGGTNSILPAWFCWVSYWRPNCWSGASSRRSGPREAGSAAGHPGRQAQGTATGRTFHGRRGDGVRVIQPARVRAAGAFRAFRVRNLL